MARSVRDEIGVEWRAVIGGKRSQRAAIGGCCWRVSVVQCSRQRREKEGANGPSPSPRSGTRALLWTEPHPTTSCFVTQSAVHLVQLLYRPKACSLLASHHLALRAFAHTLPWSIAQFRIIIRQIQSSTPVQHRCRPARRISEPSAAYILSKLRQSWLPTCTPIKTRTPGNKSPPTT